jgi:hypothetical protein
MPRKKWRTKDYVVVPRALLSENMSPMALRTWLALASFSFSDEPCFPSNRAMLKRMPEGTTERSLQRAKKELMLKGLLRQERRFKGGRETSSLYYLMAPDNPDDFVTLHDDKDAPITDATVTPLNKNTIKKTRDGDIFIEGVGWVRDN